jgi:hypothetical protein
MEKGREHPLYYLSIEDTIIATFVWLDDQLKALTDQGLRLPRQKAQKASTSERLTIAVMITLLGMDAFKGYLIFTQIFTSSRAPRISPALHASCATPKPWWPN